MPRYYLTNQPPLDAEPYGAIVGAPKCLASPRSCDLSRGIVVDDKTGKITFHLRHPDPDFLAKLAMPLAAAIPPDAPRHDSGRHPLPATGPYVIIRYDIWQYVLVRNPYFHEWSPDAQPDGYPDRIVWRVYKKTSQAVSAVEHGAADWLYFAPEPTTQQIHEIETNYAAQTHPSAYPATDVLVIEPNSPLSRDRSARQAIAYAIDRDRLHTCPEQRQQQRASAIDVPAGPAQLPRVSALLPLQARPCACSEARTPLAKLRQAGLGPLLTSRGRTPADYFVELLNSLGFRARLTPVDEDGVPKEPQDITLYSWVADYVGASDFILGLRRGLITSSDLTDAYAEQSEGQYQGTRAWAAADQRITDDALVIPIGTGSTLGLTSKRVGNFQTAPAPGNSPMMDQMWVR